MTKATFTVSQAVDVEVDETKFTPDFMDEFRRHMYAFDTVDDHMSHLAQLAARGLADDWGFIEGYGNAKEFGIRFHIPGGSTEIEKQ